MAPSARTQSPIYSRFILSCIDTAGCLGPGTPSINQVKTDLGLSTEKLGSILQTGDYDNAFGKITSVVSDKSTLSAGYLFTDVTNVNTAATSPGQKVRASLDWKWCPLQLSTPPRNPPL